LAWGVVGGGFVAGVAIGAEANCSQKHANHSIFCRLLRIKQVMRKSILIAVFVCASLFANAQRWQVNHEGILRADSTTTIDGKPTTRLEGAGAAMQMPVMVKFHGDTLRFAGKIRTEMQGGRVDIALQAQSDMESMGHIYTEKLRVDSDEWQPFELEMPLIDEVNFCFATVHINGSGTAWLADVGVTVDGKPIPVEVTRRPVVSRYRADSVADASASGFVTPRRVTNRNIENLKAACRAWGEIKYTHPAVARGGFEMDSELFKLLPLIFDAPSKDRNRILDRWKAGFGEYDKKAEPPIYHYYFGKASGEGPAMFRHEREYPDMDYTDAGMRLLGAFRLWNVVRYFSPYLEHADDQDKVLTEAVKNMLATEDFMGYLKSLRLMAQAMNDSHVHVNSNKMDSTIMAAPFRVGKFIDGMFIPTDIFGDNNPLKQGDAIKRVNGLTVKQYIAENAWRYSASNPTQLEQRVGWIVNQTREKGPICLEVVRDGKTINVEVPIYTIGQFIPIAQAYYGAKEKIPPYKVLDGDILCIHMDNINTIDIPIEEYDKVIVDYRGYAANDASPIISRLLPETAEIAHFASPDPLHPGRFIMRDGDYLPCLSTKPDRRIVLIVDENTMSNSEYLSMALQNNPNVYTIGSQTAGADGNITTITLPGAMSMSFTGLGVFYPDGGETQRIGVRIDEVIHPTLESIRNGADNVLNRAVDILS
jgi:hypothetical protein